MKNIDLVLALSLMGCAQLSSAQISGCTDPLAINYNSSATVNDGTCLYSAASIAPVAGFNLGSNLAETSGLIQWNHQIWTHTDDQDTNLYALDTINGNILPSYALGGVVNNDWEEIAQDDDFIYIGDFGNNVNGNRTDLNILRINKNTLLAQVPIIDTIHFSYSNQVDFTPAGANKTDFDCEAFIATSDSLFLFNKQWMSNKTSVYALPKTPGTYTAQLTATYDIQGLITGATYLASSQIIALCGYSNLLQPFVYLLYDFKNSDFFGGNKRKITLSLPFHQVEGIATANGLKYYITNEYFSQPPILTIPQKMHIVDLSAFLGHYLNPLPTAVASPGIEDHFAVYPVPTTQFISVKTSQRVIPNNYRLTNSRGQVVLTGQLTTENQRIDLSNLLDGVYFLMIGHENDHAFKVIKKCGEK